MKTQKPLFIVVALMVAPDENSPVPDSAVLLASDTRAKTVIALARNPENGGMLFKTGHCISVYRVYPRTDLRCYKDHRIGDDTYSASSPIVLIRHFNGQEWEEKWFDKKLEKYIGPKP